MDQARERGGSASSRSDGDRANKPNDRASSEHKAQLEALFAKGGLAKLAEVAQARSNSSAPIVAASTPTQGDEGRAPAAPPAPPRDDAKLLLRAKILEALGREEISRAVDRYLKQYELPDDFEVLEQALEHTKQERVLETLDRLEKLLELRQPKRSRTLAGKLRLLAETASDDDVRARAEAVRPKLK